MHDLHKIGLDRTIAFLQSIKCEFKIFDEDGNVYTNMVENNRRTRKPSLYVHGELSAHVKKHLNGIEVGQIVIVPIDKFDAVAIARSATNIMHVTYGAGSYASHTTESGIEILRQF